MGHLACRLHRQDANVTFNYNAHQHTSKGSVPGISGNVDLNVTTLNYPKIIRKKGLTRLREA